MNDDRMERLLRRGPPGDPSFEPSGRWLDAGERELEQEPVKGARSRTVTLFAGLAAVAAILVVAVIGGQLIQLRDQGVGGLVADIERRGTIRVAIDGGPPQAFTPARGYDGFDLDIAREVAERLGVRLDVVVVPRAALLTGEAEGRWDVAISSIPAAISRDESAPATNPYAVVSGAVVVNADDTAEALSDLASASVCVVTGSTAEAWLDNGLTAGPGDTIQPVPASMEARVQATLAECLGGLADGGWRGVIVDRASDVAGAGNVRVLDDAPFELRLVAVVNGGQAGAEALVVRLNRIFAEMADEGAIADISRRRFAGIDVTP
jgi:ABC-type amino acid transport substrate-binding protein